MELIALLQRWQHHLAPDATVPLVGDDASRVRSLLDHCARLLPDLAFRGLRRLATA